MKTPNLRMLLCVGVLFAAVCASPLSAESTHGAWLRYAPIEGRAQENYASLPAAIVRLGDSSVLTTAQAEMIRGVRGMLGKTLRAEKDLPREEAIVLGTLASIQAVVPGFGARSPLGEEGFWLTTENLRGFPCFIVTATTDRGVLYGVFGLTASVDTLATFRNSTQSPILVSSMPSTAYVPRSCAAPAVHV